MLRMRCSFDPVQSDRSFRASGESVRATKMDTIIGARLQFVKAAIGRRYSFAANRVGYSNGHYSNGYYSNGHYRVD